jgi:DNA-binding NarL/FixJ family response regulator
MPTPVILCVEDEKDLLDELVEELNALGYEALGARTAQQAEVLVAQRRPDVILCDILMPERNGFEFLGDLRHFRPDLDAVPFVFLTALTSRDDQLAGRRLGADDYLAKPVDFDLLDAVIRAKLSLVRRVHSASQATGPALAPPVHLSRREAEVLVELAKGKTISGIAQTLSLSTGTVGSYVKSLYGKLGISNRAEATQEALRRGLVKV